jgi:predicted aldo/keto reductase-like oxidoreductase
MADKTRMTRRDLFKIGAGAGALAATGGMLAGSARAQDDAKKIESLPQVPRRVLGKTGKSIPILVMGGAMKLDPKFDPKFAECMRFGVNYIDAADCYGGGTCESAVGGFLKNGNVDRSTIWITSKSDKHDPAGLEETLDRGLKRMGTDYFDLYFMHALKDPASISPEMGKKVEELKKSGRIRHFGFSCHDGTVVELLNKAAATPYIEAVMFRYNFRQYGDKELNAAIDACAKAGVGLIAMKTQGSEASFADAWGKFQQEGKWSKHQAVLKAVWADDRITAAVSHMDTFEKLKENIAAAVDQFDLGAAEYEALNRYAAATRSMSCDGCDHLCNPAVDAPVRIGTTMRYLMYHEVYGEQENAKRLFAELPAEERRLSGIDFRGANAACPNGIDVAAQMQKAAKIFNA